MDISESLELIIDTTKEYFEDRLFKMYVEVIDKEKFPSYESYKDKATENIEIVDIDIEERKRQAERTLEEFMKGCE